MSSRITVAGPPVDRAAEILTPAALDFLADLHERFAPRRDELLGAAAGPAGRRGRRRTDGLPARHRRDPLRRLDRRADPGVPGRSPGGDHRPDRPQDDDQRAELGAKIWLADLEDANTPAWANVISGQVNLRDAIRRHHHAGSGRQVLPAERRRRWPSSSPGRAAGTCRRST